jgi:hypothetical protein
MARLIVHANPIGESPVGLRTRARTLHGAVVSACMAVPALMEADGQIIARLNGDEVSRDVWRVTEIVQRDVIEVFVRPADIVTAATTAWGVIKGLFSAKTFLSSAWKITQFAMAAYSVVSLFRQAPRAPGQEDRLYQLTGGSNQALPRQRLPIVFGETRMTPPKAAEDFLEFVGDQIWLNVALNWGQKDIDVEAIKLGETLLSEFGADVEVQHHLKAGDPPLTMWPGDVNDAAVGAELVTPNAWVSRTTAPDTDRIVLIFGFRQGLVSIDSKGGRNDMPRTVAYRYRPAGSTNPADWTAATVPMPAADAAARLQLGIDDRLELGINLSAWSAAAAGGSAPASQSVTFRAASQQPLTRTVELAVPRGQYTVEVMSPEAATTAPRDVNRVWWEGLRSVTSESPFKEPTAAITLLRIRATDRVSGAAPAVSGIVKRRTRTRTGGGVWSAGVTGASRNLADTLLWLLQGPHLFRPTPDAEINLAELEEVWQWSNTNGFRADGVYQGEEGLEELIERVAATARVLVYRTSTGSWGFKIDRARPALSQSQMMNAATVHALSVNVVYPPEVHGLRATYLDRSKDYVEEEMIVYADGWSAATATLIERADPPYITDAVHLRQWLTTQMRLMAQRRRTVELEDAWDHLVCDLHDLAFVQHPELGDDLVGAEVLGVGLIGGLIDNLTLSHPCPPGSSLALQWRRVEDLNGGDAQVRSDSVAAIGALTPDRRTVYFSPRLAPATGPKVGTLVSIGPAGAVTIPMQIQSIAPSDEHRARVTLIDYAEAAFTGAPGGVVLAGTAREPDTVAACIAPVVRRLRRAVTVGFGLSAGLPVYEIRSGWRRAGTTDPWVWQAPAAPNVRSIRFDWDRDEASRDLILQAMGMEGAASTPLLLLAQSPTGQLAQPEGFSAAAAVITSLGGAQVPVIAIQCNAIDDLDVDSIGVEVAEVSPGNVLLPWQSSPPLNARNPVGVVTAVRPGGQHRVRIQARSAALGLASDWVESGNITVADLGAAKLGNITPGDILPMSFDVDGTIRTFTSLSLAFADAAKNALWNNVGGRPLNLAALDLTASQTLSTVNLAVSSPNPNLFAEPSGRGNAAAASTVGWTGASGLVMASLGPAGGPYYQRLFLNSASLFVPDQTHIYRTAVGGAGTYTLSWHAWRSSGLAARVRLVARDAGGASLGASAWADLRVGAGSDAGVARQSLTYTATPVGTTNLDLELNLTSQTINGSLELGIRQIKLERGATATAYSEEARAQLVQARVEDVATAAMNDTTAVSQRVSNLLSDLQGTASNLHPNPLLTTPSGASAAGFLVRSTPGANSGAVAVTRTGVLGAYAIEAAWTSALTTDVRPVIFGGVCALAAGAIVAGQRYALGIGLVGLSGSAGGVWVQGIWLNASGVQVGSFILDAIGTTPTSTTSVGGAAFVSGVAPAGAVDIAFEVVAFKTAQSATAAGSVRVAWPIVSPIDAAAVRPPQWTTGAALRATADVLRVDQSLAQLRGSSALTMSQVQAKFTPNPNLWPDPSGDGSGAAISSTGWLDGTGAVNGNVQAYGGRVILRQYPTGASIGAAQFASRRISVPANTEVTLSLSAGRGNFNASWQIYALDASNNIVLTGPAAQQFPNVVGGGRQSATITTPATATQIQLSVIVPAQTTTGYGDWWIRQIKLEVGSVDTGYSEEGRTGALEGRVTSAEAVNTSQGAAIAGTQQAITAARDAYNLLFNGGLVVSEPVSPGVNDVAGVASGTRVVGWWRSGGWFATSDGGGHRLMLFEAANGFYEVVSPWAPAELGGPYSASAEVTSLLYGSTLAQLRIDWGDASGSVVQSGTFADLNVGQTGGWQTLGIPNGTVTSPSRPSGATQVRVTLRVTVSGSSAGRYVLARRFMITYGTALQPWNNQADIRRSATAAVDSEKLVADVTAALVAGGSSIAQRQTAFQNSFGASAITSEILSAYGATVLSIKSAIETKNQSIADAQTIVSVLSGANAGQRATALQNTEQRAASYNTFVNALSGDMFGASVETKAAAVVTAATRAASYNTFVGALAGAELGATVELKAAALVTATERAASYNTFIGVLKGASVSAKATAVQTAIDRSANYLVAVTGSGGTTELELASDKAGSVAALRAAKVVLSGSGGAALTVSEGRAFLDGVFSARTGNTRITFLGESGAAIWVGPSSVPMGSETAANASLYISGTSALVFGQPIASSADNPSLSLSTTVTTKTVFGGSGAITSDVVTATPVGGSGWTYSWTFLSGDSGSGITNPTSQATSFSFSFSGNGERSGLFQCTATNSAGKSATQVVQYVANREP